MFIICYGSSHPYSLVELSKVHHLLPFSFLFLPPFLPPSSLLPSPTYTFFTIPFHPSTPSPSHPVDRVLHSTQILDLRPPTALPPPSHPRSSHQHFNQPMDVILSSSHPSSHLTSGDQTFNQESTLSLHPYSYLLDIRSTNQWTRFFWLLPTPLSLSRKLSSSK